MLTTLPSPRTALSARALFFAGLLATGRLHMSAELRTFVFVGILGGFTTFSSFGI